MRNQAEINRKISETMRERGIRPPSQKGKSRTQETRRKISSTLTARSARAVAKLSACLLCGKEFAFSRKKYCSRSCGSKGSWAVRKEEVFVRIEGGERVDVRQLRRYLLKTKGSCVRCGGVEWMGQRLALQIHHKDFNAKNNVLSNVELLCPNCRSLTENYTGKGSRGIPRKRRGVTT